VEHSGGHDLNVLEKSGIYNWRHVLRPTGGTNPPGRSSLVPRKENTPSLAFLLTPCDPSDVASASRQGGQGDTPPEAHYRLVNASHGSDGASINTTPWNEPGHLLSPHGLVLLGLRWRVVAKEAPSRLRRGTIVWSCPRVFLIVRRGGQGELARLETQALFSRYEQPLIRLW
jgi:hypothetical protein